MFECNVCHESFEDADHLQDHFTKPLHMSAMLINPDVSLCCQICRFDVTLVDFTDHILSLEHRSNLRTLVFADKPTKEGTNKLTIDRKKVAVPRQGGAFAYLLLFDLLWRKFGLFLAALNHFHPLKKRNTV